MNNELRNSIKKFNEMMANFDLNLLNNLGKTTNLKLHDIVHEYEDMNYFYNIFNDFCQCEYEHFLEILNCNNIKIEHIGRTSSLYLNHENFDLFDYNYHHEFEDKEPFEKLKMLILNEINQMGFDFGDFTLFANSIISVDEEYIDYEDINMLINEIESTTDILKDLNCMYNYIESFKERQCEIFAEFIENLEF